MPLSPEAKTALRNRDFRMDNMYSILNKDWEKVRFVRNSYQKKFDEEKHGRDIILKSRQLGMTTLMVVDAFDSVVMKPNTYAMFIAHQKRESDAILKNKIPTLFDNWKLKNFLYYKKQIDQAWEFRIGFDEKDESINSFIRAGTSGVSGTYQFMHISELAVMEREEKWRADEVLRGTLAVPYDGRIVIESTARWDYGKFHDMFVEAWDRTQSGHKLLPTEYKAHFFNWFDDPEIQKVNDLIPFSQMKEREFFEKTKSDYKLNDAQISWWYGKYQQLNYDKNLLLSEYPRSISDSFRSSSNSYFNQDLIDLHLTREPIAVSGGWKFFSKYNASHTYCLGADPAGGKGGDNAAIIVIDITTGEVCAEFCNKFTTPSQLADEINMIATNYWRCLVWVEVNNHWHAVIERLKHLNYPNIYSRYRSSSYTDVATKELWFLTTSLTKPAILSNLSLGINTFALQIVSESIKSELSRYPREAVDMIWGDDEIGHFDRVMALSICWEMRKHITSGNMIVS